MSNRLRPSDAEVQMTPEKIRAVARKLDALAVELCPDGCRPDLVIGSAIDHLYAMAASQEALTSKAGQTEG